mgnify:FL=1|tara:strand:- start:10556 stop:10993 length:438 start_codon:yes stop_codon:yes gene_type:complete
MKKFFTEWGLEIVSILSVLVIPISNFLVFMTILVVTDLITGLMKAQKLAIADAKLQGLPKPAFFEDTMESNKLSRTLSKWVIYTLGLIIANGSTLYMFPEYEAAKIVLMGITFIEVKSLDENFKIILGYSIFGKLLGLLSRTQAK